MADEYISSQAVIVHFSTNMAAMNGDGFPSNANETLYCSNLPDKLQKDDLKRELYMLFTTYGPVLDIVALKTMKMRGQAHVLFRDRIASTQALRDLNNREFFGKQMVEVPLSACLARND